VPTECVGISYPEGIEQNKNGRVELEINSNVPSDFVATAEMPSETTIFFIPFLFACTTPEILIDETGSGGKNGVTM
jgi:hypothetical protein